MSDYYDEQGYEQGYAPDPADLEALTAQARQETIEYIAPVLRQQQEAIGMLSQHAAAQTAQAYREQQSEDDRVAHEALKIVSERYPRGWWEQNGQEIRDAITARPGLLPDEVLESSDPRHVADALDTAAKTLQREAQQAAQAERARKHARDLGEMRQGLGGGTGMGPSWRALRESGKTVDQLMRGE
jgi:hypothetical protein